jgi:lysozyme
VTSAQGIDVSHYQQPVTAAQLAGLDFAFAKATDGARDIDERFAANWAAIRSSGRFRGAYHEQRHGDPAGQAAHFLATVQAQGLMAGDMLAVSVSDYKVADTEAREFLDAVSAATGGRNPVICYTDLSVGAGLPSCAGYPLWIARPADIAPASVAPWAGWTFWQWNMTRLDQDAFNGTPAAMATWIATYAQPAPIPVESWEDKLMTAIPTVQKGSTNRQAVLNWQGLLIANGYDLGTTGKRKDGVDGEWGALTDQATRDFQAAKGVKDGPDGVVGRYTYTAALSGSAA